jgi:quercetin dioxygenase-like cupin family protein
VKTSDDPKPKNPHYTVKDSQLVLACAQMQARLLTLAPGDNIPWHYHSEVTDHYFVLRGILTVNAKNTGEAHDLEVGSHHEITPGTTHSLSNRNGLDCQFLLLQGVGEYDWIKGEN